MIVPSDLTRNGQNFLLGWKQDGKISMVYRRPALQIRPWCEQYQTMRRKQMFDPAHPKSVTLLPQLWLSIQVIQTMKKSVESIQPCRSPKSTVDGCHLTPPTRIQTSEQEYEDLIFQFSVCFPENVQYLSCLLVKIRFHLSSIIMLIITFCIFALIANVKNPCFSKIN